MIPMFANLVLDFFLRGGPIMWPILLCLIAALVVIVERALWWWQLERQTSADTLDECFEAISTGDFDAATELASHGADPYLRTVRDGLEHAHSSLLGAMQLRASAEIELAESRQWVLGTFITLAPLLGLLGTVVGIMHSFSFRRRRTTGALHGERRHRRGAYCNRLRPGIAMLCLLPYNYLNRRLARFRSRLERTINHVELLVESAKQHGHDLEEFARERARDQR
jgi:biopolymer transport protein ExbB